MNSVVKLIAMFLLLSLAMAVNAQGLSKDEMKNIKKEVKRYEKDGWKTMPGALSLSDQLMRSRKVQLEEDDEGDAKWQIGTATSIGTIYDAARMQAMTLAKAELSGLITTNLTEKYVAASENQQMPLDQAESMAKAAMEAKAVTVDQRIGNPRVIFDAYRKLPNGNVEVTLRVAILVKKINDIPRLYKHLNLIKKPREKQNVMREVRPVGYPKIEEVAENLSTSYEVNYFNEMKPCLYKKVDFSTAEYYDSNIGRVVIKIATYLVNSEANRFSSDIISDEIKKLRTYAMKELMDSFKKEYIEMTF